MQQSANVKVFRTPDAVLDAQLAIWDQIVQRESAADPFFAKVVKSQQEWANRVVPMRQTMASDPITSLSAKKWVKPPIA